MFFHLTLYIRVGDAFKMNAGNTQGKLVYAPPPKKDAITDEGKIKPEGVQKGLCKQLNIPDDQCSKDQIAKLYDQAEAKVKQTYQDTVDYYSTKSGEQIWSDTKEAGEAVGEYAAHKGEQVVQLAEQTYDYWSNVSGAQAWSDSKAAAGVVADVVGDTFSEIGEWFSRTNDNIEHASGAGETSGVLIGAIGKAVYEVGNPFKKGKAAAKAADAALEAAEAAEKAKKLAAAKKKAAHNTPNSNKRHGKDGGSVKKIHRTKVKCFDKHNKYNEKEYERQLKNQENGLNKMSVDEYIAARGAYSGITCNEDGSVGKNKAWNKSRDRPKRNESKANKVRSDYREWRERQLYNDHPDLDDHEISALLDSEMSNLAALHNPDMIAAGLDMFNAANIEVVMGDSRINSSIGSSWRGRIGALDEAACKAKKEKKGHQKMNVKLERCKKK